MGLSVHDGDLRVNGTLSSKYFNAPAGSVTNDDIEGAAGIDASKLEHVFIPFYSESDATTAATKEMTVHISRASGTLVDFFCGLKDNNAGSATVACDLLVGSTSVLQSAVTLSSGHANHEVVQGTISTTGLTADNVISIDITATAGGGTLGKGLFAGVKLREDYT